MSAAAPRILPSVCPLDCPDTCSLSVAVEGERVVGVRGSHANPYTAGVLCQKVAKHYPSFVHGPRRLSRPLRRSGPRGSGQFQAVSWDEALDLVHEGLSRAIAAHGPQSVLPLNYAGPHGQLAGGSMDRRFFHRLGASLLDRGPLCGGVRGAAYVSLFGSVPGMAPELARESDVIAVWGSNVTVSNLHFARVVQAARKNGATLIVVDPKRTRIAEQAQLFLQIRPGTDVVLALALAAELDRRGAFDGQFIARWVQGHEAFLAEARKYTLAEAARICGVPREQIARLADCYAGAERLALAIGNGIERGHSGGSALRAIMSLNALLGQLGRCGAGVIAKLGFAFPLTAATLQRPDLVPAGTRTVNIVDVSRLLLDDGLRPPIRAVFIYNHNPVATHPDQNRMRRALSQEKLFVVGCELVMTDSLSYADVILPACSHFEHHDLYTAYGHSHLQRAEPVIPPVGEALPNTEIFRRLAARFGFDDPPFRESDQQLMDAAFDAQDSRLQGHRPSELPLDRALPMTAENGAPLLVCGTVKPGTPSGKVELYSADLEARYGCGLPRYQPVVGSYPLILITPSSSQRTNATFGGEPASAGLEGIEIHPGDAGARGIASGDSVRVWNALGEVVLRASLSTAMQPGVLYSPKGTWLTTSPSGQTVNALLSADLRTDIVGGACYNETYVELRREASARDPR